MYTPRSLLTLGLVSATLLASGCFAAPEPAAGDSETAGTEEDTAGDKMGEGDEMGEAGDTGEETGEEGNDEGGQVDMAEVRLIHASPDAGPVDIYEAGDDTPILEDIEYGDASQWLEIEAGDFDVEVRAADASPLSLPLTFATLTAAANERVNGIAVGRLDGDAEDDLRVLTVNEQWGNDVPGRARVRFVHAGADAPTVTFDGAGDEGIELERFSASEAEGATINSAGGVRLEVLGPNEDVTVTSFTSPQLAEGDDVLLVATGLLDSLAREDDGFRLMAIGSEGALEPVLQDPELFIVHGSRDSQSLEVCSDTQELAANFFYGELETTRVSPGEYSLEIFDYPAGCTGDALNGEGNLTDDLEAGERYMMLVTGERTADPGEASIQVAPFLDAFTLDDNENANVRFIHGASYTQIYVGSVDEGSITEENVFTQPIAWRAESVETAIPDGNVVLGIADAVGEPLPPYAPIVTFDIDAVGGSRQWGIVAGDPAPDDEDDGFLQLMLVDTSVPGWTVSLVDIDQ